MLKFNFLLFILVFSFLFSFGQVPADSISIIQKDSVVIVKDSVTQPNISLDQITPPVSKPIDIDMKHKPNLSKNCPYHVKTAIDLPIALLGLAGTAYGFSLINNKHSVDSTVILNLDPQRDIKLGINRKDIHNYSSKADNTSDFFLYGGFVYGLTLLIDHDIRQDAGKIMLLYLETMSITGSSYALTAGNVNKFRPYSYDKDSIIVNGIKVPEAPLSKRANHGARSSFYGGHPSVPASSALFVASVYSAYHPHSPFRFVLYGVAVAATGATVYLRYVAGAHFPTDLAIGVALGSTYGLLIPHLHRCNEDKGLSFSPMIGKAKGISLAYKF